MLLRVKTDNKGGNVDDLLSNTNVTLADQYAGVVNRLGKTKLEYLSLETTFQKVLNLESQNVVKAGLVLIQNTSAN